MDGLDELVDADAPAADANRQRELAFAIALRALVRREHSTKELMLKMRRRGIAEGMVEEISTSSDRKVSSRMSDSRKSLFVRGSNGVRVNSESARICATRVSSMPMPSVSCRAMNRIGTTVPWMRCDDDFSALGSNCSRATRRTRRARLG